MMYTEYKIILSALLSLVHTCLAFICVYLSSAQSRRNQKEQELRLKDEDSLSAVDKEPSVGAHAAAGKQ